MWWYGRGYSGGSWLPEKKKANMWPGRGNSSGSWPPAFPRSVDSMCIVFSVYCTTHAYDLQSNMALNLQP